MTDAKPNVGAGQLLVLFDRSHGAEYDVWQLAYLSASSGVARRIECRFAETSVPRADWSSAPLNRTGTSRVRCVLRVEAVRRGGCFLTWAFNSGEAASTGQITDDAAEPSRRKATRRRRPKRTRPAKTSRPRCETQRRPGRGGRESYDGLGDQGGGA